ncbi:MAG: biotin--[acetyl-CoA-carboxylase] ligase [Candidatus Nealsonbacteria bacterium]|nr:biotin--[acetyl-CoA-carboxylase] ligase [Candidatus Nealsonbacteria bacterium]
MTADRPDVDRVLEETFVARAEYHDAIASTNDRATECAGLAAQQLPLLVVAARQTAGRGRGGNRWWTGPGSLAMSLALDLDQRARSPLTALAAALAVVDTVAPLVPSQSVGLHWPNDVMVAGGKLAGVLVEVLPNRRHVLGIGVNTNNTAADAPPELQQTAVTLRDLSGTAHDPTAFLIELLRQLEAVLGRLASEPEQLGVRANSLCLQHGHTLTLEHGGRRITAPCAGIAPDGALLLEMPEGRRGFYSGVLLGGRQERDT